jgi:hypothetical protein
MGKIGKPGSLRLCPYAVLSSFSCGDVGRAIRGRAPPIVRSWDTANEGAKLSDLSAPPRCQLRPGAAAENGKCAMGVVS